MGLGDHGLRIVQRRAANFLPLNERDYLLVGERRTAAEVAKFSRRDAERLDDYEARLQRIADVLRALVLETPPNAVQGGFAAGLPELLKAFGVASRLSGLDLTGRRDLVTLFGASAGDWLDGWFESDPIKACLGFDGIVGSYASPYAPGSAYVLLHHCFGEVNGRKGAWGHAIGGMGAITEAMASACHAQGVTIRTEAPVAEVVVRNGRAVGVATEAGESVAARAVVSNLNPKLLFGRMVEASALPEDFRERIGRYRCGSGVLRMNLALAELPRFACLPEPGDHLTSGVIIAPSLSYMDEAFADARRLGWSRAPIIELLIPSTLDDTLAPQGRHVASLFCQHVAPELPDGRSWDEAKDEVADLMIATVDRYAPGLARQVIARQVLSPLDLERLIGLTAGDIMHGRLTADQLYSARPVLGHADYRTPVAGLYQCGAGTHPGGGVTGAPGHNAAREVARDFRRGRIGR
jgi:phytoene dehydrogenase-like protein